jgi:hypothetical protein
MGKQGKAANRDRAALSNCSNMLSKQGDITESTEQNTTKESPKIQTCFQTDQPQQDHLY